MRTKLRVANLFPCVDWAAEMLKRWREFDESITEKLIFLKQHEGFIQELSHLQIHTCQLPRLGKNRCGFF